MDELLGFYSFYNGILPKALSASSSLSLAANIYFVSSSTWPRNRNLSGLNPSQALVLKQETIVRFYQFPADYTIHALLSFPSATNLVQGLYIGVSVAS